MYNNATPYIEHVSLPLRITATDLHDIQAYNIELGTTDRQEFGSHEKKINYLFQQLFSKFIKEPRQNIYVYCVPDTSMPGFDGYVMHKLLYMVKEVFKLFQVGVMVRPPQPQLQTHPQVFYYLIELDYYFELQQTAGIRPNHLIDTLSQQLFDATLQQKLLERVLLDDAAASTNRHTLTI
jgi:hypothetical protein